MFTTFLLLTCLCQGRIFQHSGSLFGVLHGSSVGKFSNSFQVLGHEPPHLHVSKTDRATIP